MTTPNNVVKHLYDTPTMWSIPFKDSAFIVWEVVTGFCLRCKKVHSSIGYEGSKVWTTDVKTKLPPDVAELVAMKEKAVATARAPFEAWLKSQNDGTPPDQDSYERSVGTIIMLMRKRMHLTQTEFGQQCKVHQSVISRMETGLCLTVENLIAVASAFQIKPSVLLQHAENFQRGGFPF